MTAQFPIDGKPGKAWKVTSKMGWRIHPIKKVKKHHNGTDIVASAEPCWIEAPADASVIGIGNNPAGFGNYVILRHDINGKPYTALFAHLKDGSIKVKKGTRIKAGTPLGKMGSTGASTGKHLHWELRAGKKHTWSETGKHYIEPVAFFDALIKYEAQVATAPVEAKDTDPVQPAPVHEPTKPATTSSTKPSKPAVTTPSKPARVHVVKSGDTLGAIARKYGTTTSALAKRNGIKNANVIKVGQRIAID